MNLAGIKFPGIGEPEPEQAEEQAEEQVEEQTEEQAPPPAPAPSIEDRISAAFEKVVSKLDSSKAPEPVKDDYDPDKFWAGDKNDPNPGKTLDTKMEKWLERKLGPRLQQIEAGIQVALNTKQNDPRFESTKDEVLELIKSGKVTDLQTAIEYAELKRGTRSASPKGGPAKDKVTAKAKPIPPATATSGVAKKGENKGPRIREFNDLYKDPDIQRAIDALRNETREVNY